MLKVALEVSPDYGVLSFEILDVPGALSNVRMVRPRVVVFREETFEKIVRGRT